MESKTPNNMRVLTCSKCAEDCHSRRIELETELAEAKGIIQELNRVFERDCDREEKLEAELETKSDALRESVRLCSHVTDAMSSSKKKLAEARAEIERLRAVSEHRKAIMLGIADSLENNKLTDEEEYEDELIESLRSNAEEKTALSAAERGLK